MSFNLINPVGPPIPVHGQYNKVSAAWSVRKDWKIGSSCTCLEASAPRPDKTHQFSGRGRFQTTPSFYCVHFNQRYKEKNTKWDYVAIITECNLGYFTRCSPFSTLTFGDQAKELDCNLVNKSKKTDSKSWCFFTYFVVLSVGLRGGPWPGPDAVWSSSSLGISPFSSLWRGGEQLLGPLQRFRVPTLLQPFSYICAGLFICSLPCFSCRDVKGTGA